MIDGLPCLDYCGDFVVRRGWHLGPRKLFEHELVYFPAGTFTTYELLGQKFILNQPTWVVTRRGSEHSYHFGETSATRHLFVHFSGGELYAPTLLSPKGPHTIPSREGEFPATLISHLLQIAHSKKDFQRCNIVLATLLSELEHIYCGSIAEPFPPKQAAVGPAKSKDAGTSYPRIVNAALKYIRSRLVEPITVANIAEHCNMSHEHLTRTFVRAMGVPPRQVIIQLRLEHAAYLLLHSTLNIKEIAMQSGFSENHYFSRVFAASYGLTASAYRAEYADPRIQHIEPSGLFETTYPMNSYVFFNP